MASNKTNNPNSHKKAQMLEALERSLGIVTTACNAIGIGRTTHYEWMKKDPEYKQAVKDIENRTLDFAESHIHKLIRGGNAAATIFFLKTKGKARDYVEGIEVTNYNPDGPPKWFTGDDIEQ